MKSILLRLAVNAVGLLVAARIVPGIHLEGWETILLAALIFGLVNSLIKPLVSCLTCLVNLLTLGLFTLILNAAMLWLAAWIAQGVGLGFRVEGFLAAFIGAVVISLVSFVLTKFIR